MNALEELRVNLRKAGVLFSEAQAPAPEALKAKKKQLRKVKTATLTPGRWIYICPCGFQYTACRVMATSSKWMIYCFKCKQQNGRYFKIMEDRLEFNDNYNNKLNCTCFSTLRLHDPVNNAIGAVKHIYLKGVWKGDARIMGTRQIRLEQINIPIAKLDCAMLPVDARTLIRSCYRNRPGIDWNHQLLDFIVLEYLQESKEPRLF